jgi:CRP-like cAMP-binding protein
VPRDGSRGRLWRYRKGADVWRPHDRADSIYFLQRGQLIEVIGDADGREVILRVIEVGQPVGELCFCGGPTKVRRSIIRANTESEAVEIKLDVFMNYLQENRDVLTAFVFTFCIRLADAERRIEVLAHRGAEQRLGRLLLHLAAAPQNQARANATTRPGEVRLDVSHDELAQRAAMSRPHVTVTMGRLRRRGFVRYERGYPLVVNVEALTKYLEGER